MHDKDPWKTRHPTDIFKSQKETMFGFHKIAQKGKDQDVAIATIFAMLFYGGMIIWCTYEVLRVGDTLSSNITQQRVI